MSTSDAKTVCRNYRPGKEATLAKSSNKSVAVGSKNTHANKFEADNIKKLNVTLNHGTTTAMETR